MVLLASDEWRYYGHGPLFVVSHGPSAATAATVETTARVVREYGAQQGQPLAYVVLIEPDGARLTPEAGAALETMQRGLSSELIACQAVAVLGTGFLAGHFISFSSRLFLSLRERDFPARAFGAIDDVARWVSNNPGPQCGSAGEIERALGEIQVDAARAWAGAVGSAVAQP